MAVNKRKKAINALNKYIWTLKGKCDGIAEINKSLVLEYCRFAVMAAEMSEEMQNNLDSMDEMEFDAAMKKYEKFNKVTLNLYKTLQFGQIKDELADFGNPYTKLFKEAEADGDF